MAGALLVTRTPRRLSVCRAPTTCDRVACLLAVLFCTIATAGGVALTVRFGFGFLFIVSFGLLSAAIFAFLMFRGCSVHVEGAVLILPRAFRNLRLPAAHVLNLTPIPGPDAGVRVTHLQGEEVVLFGLSEKDRARAARLLRDALNEALACRDDEHRCGDVDDELPVTEQV